MNDHLQFVLAVGGLFALVAAIGSLGAALNVYSILASRLVLLASPLVAYYLVYYDGFERLRSRSGSTESTVEENATRPAASGPGFGGTGFAPLSSGDVAIDTEASRPESRSPPRSTNPNRAHGSRAGEETRLWVNRPARSPAVPFVVGGLVLVVVGAWLGHTAGLSLSWLPLIVVSAGFVLAIVPYLGQQRTRHVVSPTRAYTETGYLRPERTVVRLHRLRTVECNQSRLQRLLGYGDVTVAAGPDADPLVFEDARRPAHLVELLRENAREARERRDA
ncbi:hypothetical protein BRC90_02415 [Halobacteriales archaeon QS_4_69_34]|nr:MAG: hypothetical protein BRC90_02415 [Halobacteriales archaeon QS_4_69_34]